MHGPERGRGGGPDRCRRVCGHGCRMWRSRLPHVAVTAGVGCRMWRSRLPRVAVTAAACAVTAAACGGHGCRMWRSRLASAAACAATAAACAVTAAACGGHGCRVCGHGCRVCGHGCRVCGHGCRVCGHGHAAGGRGWNGPGGSKGGPPGPGPTRTRPGLTRTRAGPTRTRAAPTRTRAGPNPARSPARCTGRPARRVRCASYGGRALGGRTRTRTECAARPAWCGRRGGAMAADPRSESRLPGAGPPPCALGDEPGSGGGLMETGQQQRPPLAPGEPWTLSCEARRRACPTRRRTVRVTAGPGELLDGRWPGGRRRGRDSEPPGRASP
jgi:hypothetical protein